LLGHRGGCVWTHHDHCNTPSPGHIEPAGVGRLTPHHDGENILKLHRFVDVTDPTNCPNTTPHCVTHPPLPAHHTTQQNAPVHTPTPASTNFAWRLLGNSAASPVFLFIQSVACTITYDPRPTRGNRIEKNSATGVGSGGGY